MVNSQNLEIQVQNPPGDGYGDSQEGRVISVVVFGLFGGGVDSSHVGFHHFDADWRNLLLFFQLFQQLLESLDDLQREKENEMLTDTIDSSSDDEDDRSFRRYSCIG